MPEINAVSPAFRLKDIALLSRINEAGLVALEAAVNCRVYKKNTIIVTQGDDTDSLYLVQEGSVRVYISDDQGRELTLNILSAGDSFGELALLNDQPRSANVMAMEDSRCWVVAKEDFLNCMKKCPGMSHQIIKSLINRVLELTDEVSSLALLDVYGRVRRMLLNDAKEKDGKLHAKRLTHQAIASRVGSSREMVSKILSDLNQGGYISVNKDTICIETTLPSGW